MNIDDIRDNLLETIARERPYLLPGAQLQQAADLANKVSHGTTIVALKYKGGVMIGGDTRSTMGMFVHDEHKKKVHALDRYAAAGFAGVSAMCDEYAGLLTVVFANYRKIHRETLDFTGKINVVSSLLQKNPHLMHGMITVPILIGRDEGEAGKSHIVMYDSIGGITKKEDYASLGSGGMFAQMSLRKTWRRTGGMEMSRDTATKLMVEALWDSAVPQAGSSPPDLRRNIVPSLLYIECDGVTEVAKTDIVACVKQIEQEFGDE